jgi:hypothetical protein
MGHQTRIMYIENKGGGYMQQWGLHVPSGGELTGPGRIGRITFSKTGKTIYYGGKTFNRCNGDKANYVCEETGESYWISGPKKRGGDSLYATNIATEIDEDVREEYWTEIRKKPELIHQRHS